MLAFIPHKEGDHLTVSCASYQAHRPQVHRPAEGRDCGCSTKEPRFPNPLPYMVLRQVAQKKNLQEIWKQGVKQQPLLSEGILDSHRNRCRRNQLFSICAQIFSPNADFEKGLARSPHQRQ